MPNCQQEIFRPRKRLASILVASTLSSIGLATLGITFATPANAQLSSPPSGSALNDNTGIQSSPVSCGFSDPNGPFTFDSGLVGTIEPSNSVSLPSGSSDYYYVGSDAGGNPLTSISWSEDLSVIASYSGNKSVSIGQSSSDAGSFDSEGTTNVAIAGVGVSGYQLVNKYTASTSSNGTSLSLNFTTGTGDLVLVLYGGEGVGLIQQGGVSLTTLLNDTYSECGSNVIASAAVFGGFLTPGSYTASFSATTYPTNSGTAAGAVAYVLSQALTPQSITFTSTAPSNAIAGGPPYVVSATGGGSGNPVVFSSATSYVCSVSGSTVTFSEGGTCTIEANQAGNANFEAAPTAMQSFSVKGISSASSADASSESPFSFTVTTVGTPVPRLKKTGGLPRGMKFHNNGNGTATLSGVPTSTNHKSVAGTYPLTFIAIFGKGKTKQVVTQDFTLKVT